MKKILIVDDDELIAQLERDYLEKEGFEVAIAFDGDTGLNLAGTGDFHAFILDVMLPGKSGIELCKEIRKKFRTPIIIVSAKTGIQDIVQEIGADDFLRKPFSLSELVFRVKTQIRLHDS